MVLPKDVDDILEEIKSNPLPELAPGKLSKVCLPDGHICYEIIESKNPNSEYIMLLHGLGQSMLSFPPFFYEPMLNAGYNIIRVDHKGGGASSWMKEWEKGNKYTLEDMANDAMAVAKQVELNKFHLIGMSMGGMISQRMAINHPDKISSFTSIMSTGFYDDPELKNLPHTFRLKFILALFIYGRKLNTVEQKVKLHLSINRQLMGSGDYVYNTKWTLLKAYYECTRRNGYNAKARDQHSYAIKKSGSRLEELKQLEIPTLIIHGTSDPLVHLSHGEKCAKIIPNAKKLFLEGMGHHLPKEYCEEITNVIIDHCQQNSNISTSDNTSPSLIQGE